MSVSWDIEEGLKRKFSFLIRLSEFSREILIGQKPSSNTFYCLSTEFLDPTLRRLSSIANFTVSSQILRYMDATIAPKANTKIVEFKEAAKIINSVESRLGKFVLILLVSYEALTA